MDDTDDIIHRLRNIDKLNEKLKTFPSFFAIASKIERKWANSKQLFSLVHRSSIYFQNFDIEIQILSI